MHADTTRYHAELPPAMRPIAEALAQTMARHLPDAQNKVWHGHPVWFLDGNPVVGYSLQKAGLRLMFWSGADFDEPGLPVRGAKFKDASVFYASMTELDPASLERWLEKARRIQWDYRNLVRRKGRLERLPPPATP